MRAARGGPGVAWRSAWLTASAAWAVRGRAMLLLVASSAEDGSWCHLIGFSLHTLRPSSRLRERTSSMVVTETVS